MLKRIFPPINELTVFVITVTILSMFFYMDGWAEKAVQLSAEFIENIFDKINEPTSLKDLVSGYFALFFGPILVFIIIIGPLFLPFSSKDLRGICAIMILIDASIFTYNNVGIFQADSSIINGFIAFYSVIWVIYLFVVVKMKQIDYLISHYQTNVVPSCIAACVSVVSVFVAIEVFSIHWGNAYCMGAILTSILFTSVPRSFVGIGYNNKRNTDSSAKAPPPVR